MNTRKTILAALFAAAFATPLAVAPVHAQVQAQAPQRAFTQAELDQMLAPIALYPDPLLSQVLMAATYPIEVVEAARWSRANPNLQGDNAVRAVENQDWDPSVKSLVAFPQILQRMDEQLTWTESLGDAFLAQESAVMDSVQHLRQRAQSAGNLQSSEQIRVEQQGPTILIEPASPQYVYVPYYDPLVVYGTWWWPAYRPVAWAPWPGYARPYRTGPYASFWWGQPIGLSVNFFFGDVDWRYRRVHVARPTAYYYRPPVYVNRSFVAERGRWQHDPHHRRGVDYRAPEVRQRFAAAGFDRRDAQRATIRQERTADRRDERGMERRDSRQTAQPAARQFAPATQAVPEASARPQQRDAQREGRERGAQDRAERREAQRPEARQAQPPRARPDFQAQPRPDQTRPERREAREEQPRQRADAQAAERAQQQQQRQQAEAARAQQHQQREQAQAAQRAQHEQQRQAQQQAQQQARQQRQEQRAAMPAAQAPQTPRAERQERREERRGERGERGNGKGGERS